MLAPRCSLPTEKGFLVKAVSTGCLGAPSRAWGLRPELVVEGLLLILLTCASPLGFLIQSDVPGLSCLVTFARAVPLRVPSASPFLNLSVPEGLRLRGTQK